MAATSTPYLTKSKHGVWYYQRWLPHHIRKKNPQINNIFRISLCTKDKPRALSISRLLSVKFDKEALKYFDSPELFADAMKMLYESAQASEQFSNFLDYEKHFFNEV
jgi:hypothetical protein